MSPAQVRDMTSSKGRTGRPNPRPDYTDADVQRALTGGNSTWMSMTQVCDCLDESRSTIDKWRARGVFPSGRRKPNGSLMFARTDVAEFIDDLDRAA